MPSVAEAGAEAGPAVAAEGSAISLLSERLEAAGGTEEVDDNDDEATEEEEEEEEEAVASAMNCEMVVVGPADARRRRAEGAR